MKRIGEYQCLPQPQELVKSTDRHKMTEMMAICEEENGMGGDEIPVHTLLLLEKNTL